jgi:hypothetical protein
MVELAGAVDMKRHTTKPYDISGLVLYVLEWSEIFPFKIIFRQRRSLAVSFLD